MSLLTELGPTYIKKGFKICPIWPGLKYPKDMADWPNCEQSLDAIAQWDRAGYTGVGLILGDIIAYDFDITVADACSDTVKDVIKTLPPGTVLIREGNNNKVMIILRASEPMKKMITPYYGEAGHRFEILCAGQLAVVEHDYTSWPVLGLSDIDLEKLPMVTPEDAVNAIKTACESLERAGFEPQSPPEPTSFETRIDDVLANMKSPLDLTDQQIADHLDRVPIARLDKYEDWVKIGMACYHQSNGDPVGLGWWELASMRSHMYQEGDCSKKWSTFGRDPHEKKIAFGTVIMWSQGNTEFNDPSQDNQDDPDAPEYIFQSLDQLRPGAIEWTIRNILQKQSITCMFGPSGSRKSFLAIDMAVSIAGGLPTWAGEPIRQHGAVAYICGEGGAGIANRIKACADAKGLPFDKSLPIVVSKIPTDFSSAEQIEKVVRGLDHMMTQFSEPPVLSIIDTLAANFSGNVNSSEEINGIYLIFRKWLAFRRYGEMNILFIAHTPHATDDRVAGSVQIYANADQSIRVLDKGDLVSSVKAMKLKESELGEGFLVTFKSHDLGYDTIDGPTTSLVIDESCGFELDIDTNKAEDISLTLQDMLILKAIKRELSMAEIIDLPNVKVKTRGAISKHIKTRLSQYVSKRANGRWYINKAGVTLLIEQG